MPHTVEYREVLRKTAVYAQATCDKCGRDLLPVFGGEEDGGAQFKDALVLQARGGYGMFLDDYDRNTHLPVDGRYDKIYCHDCGHEICNMLGISAEGWHTCDEGGFV